MQSSEAPIKVSLQDLERYRKPVAGLFERAEFKEHRRRTSLGYAGGGEVQVTTQILSVIDSAKRVSGTDLVILSEMVNHTMHTVQRGLELATHVSELYKKASGLDALVQQQRATNGFRNEVERAEFQEKNQTQGHILRFVTAHYVLFELSDYRLDVVDSVVLPKVDMPSVDYSNQLASIASMMYFYAGSLQDPLVVTPESLVQMTKHYFETILEDVKARVASMRYVEPFLDRSYQLEGSEFLVHGFDVGAKATATSAEFGRLSFGAIVGNSIAKHEARRMVFRTCCYDPVTQQNPFRELTGRLQSVRLGHGVPGTGKSMQIKATATLFQDICTLIGIPFVYHPLPSTMVSTFQGGSAERMNTWFKVFHDPRHIVYGAIDDAEQMLQDRNMQGVSAGVREIISEFLTGTEGAGASYVDRGMSVIEVFTNLPDQIDPAILSRFQSRFPINGARRWQDFLDQDYLWWKNFNEAVPEFVADMQVPSDYVLMSLQAELKSLTASLEHYDVPKNPTMRVIFDRVLGKHASNEYKFFAVLAEAVQAEFPNFSSRETRNIQSAISARMVDFDAPDEWMENPDLFFRKDYDTKLVMLKDCMHLNMGGLKLQDVWVQEVSRYLDSYADIAEMQFRREVDAEKKRRKIYDVAMSELATKKAV